MSVQSTLYGKVKQRRVTVALFTGSVVCSIAGCAILAQPDISVTPLRSGAVPLDSREVAFNLPSGVTAAHRPSLCMILDTAQYVFRPHPEKFHPLDLTDTTIHVRNAVNGAPVVLRAVLETRSGERIESDRGGYTPGNGMGTAYDHEHLLGEEGVVVCLDWHNLIPGVTYVKLGLGSNQPIVVHELTWHRYTRT